MSHLQECITPKVLKVILATAKRAPNKVRWADEISWLKPVHDLDVPQFSIHIAMEKLAKQGKMRAHRGGGFTVIVRKGARRAA